jgi:hypothetical protein
MSRLKSLSKLSSYGVALCVLTTGLPSWAVSAWMTDAELLQHFNNSTLDGR